MNPWMKILSSWSFEPTVVIGCLALWSGYLYAAKFRFDKKTINFCLGVLTLFFALVSPIDDLGDDYLFSVHMVQHIMLGLVAPPLLVTGLRESWVQSWVKLPLIAGLEKLCSIPALTMIVGVATFDIWHLPALYNATLANETLHIFEHVTFISTGTVLFWPVFKPITDRKLAPLPAVAYMFVAAFTGSILGIMFTLSDIPIYAPYAHPHDELGVLGFIRNTLGIDQLVDQKIGGALMWTVGSTIFLWAIIVVVVEYFRETEETENAERRTENVTPL